MVNNLQFLELLQTCYLRHSKHHENVRASLCALDHDALFFLLTPYIKDGQQEIFISHFQRRQDFLE